MNLMALTRIEQTTEEDASILESSSNINSINNNNHSIPSQVRWLSV